MAESSEVPSRGRLSEVQKTVVNLPHDNWCLRWLRLTAWTQLLVPGICLVLDAISDHFTPVELLWVTSNPFTNLTISFAYDNSGAAYWSNVIILLVGVLGIFAFQGLIRLKQSTQTLLREWHQKMCKIGAIFCSISTFFAVWRWQVISKAVIKNEDAVLTVPFVMSIITCFLQVLPGTASLFVPVMTVLALSESKNYSAYHTDACDYRPRSPSREVFRHSMPMKQATENSKRKFFESKPLPPKVCTPTQLLDISPEDAAVTFGDPTMKRRKLSDVTDNASDVIRNLINENMKKVDSPLSPATSVA